MSKAKIPLNDALNKLYDINLEGLSFDQAALVRLEIRDIIVQLTAEVTLIPVDNLYMETL